MFRISTLTNDYEHWERSNNNNNNGPESDYLLNNSSARHRISVRPRKTHIPIAVRRNILNNPPNIVPTSSSSSSSNNTNTATTIDRMSKITTSHNTSNQFANHSVINRFKNTGNLHFINTIKTSPHVHNTITTQTHMDHNRMYVQIKSCWNNNNNNIYKLNDQLNRKAHKTRFCLCFWNFEKQAKIAIRIFLRLICSDSKHLNTQKKRIETQTHLFITKISHMA